MVSSMCRIGSLAAWEALAISSIGNGIVNVKDRVANGVGAILDESISHWLRQYVTLGRNAPTASRIDVMVIVSVHCCLQVKQNARARSHLSRDVTTCETFAMLWYKAWNSDRESAVALPPKMELTMRCTLTSSIFFLSFYWRIATPITLVITNILGHSI